MDIELEARENLEDMVEDPAWFEMRYGKLSLDFWREVGTQFNVERLLTMMYHFYLATTRGTKNCTFEDYIEKEYPYLKELIHD